MGESHPDDDREEAGTRVRGLSPSRLAQLRADMLLTPEARVRAAEETLRLDRLREGNVTRPVMSFYRYEDYLDYKWKSSTGGA